MSGVGLEASDFLRLAILGGLVGFAAFCISYGLLVWRKRNGVASRGGSRRWGLRLAVMALLGLAGTWALNEFRTREGIAVGSDLFVVQSRRDANVTFLAPADASVQAGDVVAEFMLPAQEGKPAVLGHQRAQALAKREAVKSRPLPLDPTLLQNQAQARAQLTQAEGFLFELHRSRREVEKARIDLQTAWAREKSQLEAKISTGERAVAAAAAQLDIARVAFQRATDLRRRDAITEPNLEERRSAAVAAELEQRKHQVVLDSVRERLKSLTDRFSRGDQTYGRQLAEIERDVAQVNRSVTGFKVKLADLEAKLTE